MPANVLLSNQKDQESEPSTTSGNGNAPTEQEIMAEFNKIAPTCQNPDHEPGQKGVLRKNPRYGSFFFGCSTWSRTECNGDFPFGTKTVSKAKWDAMVAKMTAAREANGTGKGKQADSDDEEEEIPPPTNDVIEIEDD